VDEIRHELLLYYRSRNPAKAAQVDAIMAQFAGREHEVVKLLREAQAAEAQAQAQAQAQADEDDATAAPPSLLLRPLPPLAILRRRGCSAQRAACSVQRTVRAVRAWHSPPTSTQLLCAGG
jgi:hypothetical protein